MAKIKDRRAAWLTFAIWGTVAIILGTAALVPNGWLYFGWGLLGLSVSIFIGMMVWLTYDMIKELR